MAVPVVSIFGAGDYETQVKRGIETLAAGELVVLPTETVYGAAGLLASESARRRLAELRGPGKSAPFTIHLARPADANRYLDPPNEFAERLMKKLWPGPVSLCFD